MNNFTFNHQEFDTIINDLIKNILQEFDEKFEKIDVYSYFGTKNEKDTIKKFIAQEIENACCEIIKNFYER